MQAVTEYKTTTNITSIYAMRCSGATLRQIADKMGRTKERVRQILIKNYGSTKHRLISTRQLCNLTGLPKKRITEFYQDNIISPVREWDTSTGHRSLWSTSAVEQAAIINSLTSHQTIRFCRICHRPVPVNRHKYCSEKCYKESHKYKYRSNEARQRHLMNMKRYRERQKQLSKDARLPETKDSSHNVVPGTESRYFTRLPSPDSNNLCGNSALAIPSAGVLLPKGNK